MEVDDLRDRHDHLTAALADLGAVVLVRVAARPVQRG
jgi:hypothetical protein